MPHNTANYYQDTLRVPTNKTSTIRVKDMVICANALVLTILTLFQYFVYSKVTRHIMITLSFQNILVSQFSDWCCGCQLQKPHIWSVSFNLLANIKLLLSWLINIPQVYLNYKSKSTANWSVYSILLDLGGGVFSALQVVVDSIYGKTQDQLYKVRFGKHKHYF